MITKERAQELAIQYVQTLDLRGHRYQLVEVNSRERFPDEWNAVFDVYTPGGHLMDGPVVLVIEKKSGKVRSIELS